MLMKARESDRARIVDYCAPESHINLFLLADIENYGFDREIQDVWIQMHDQRLIGIVLRYFDNYIYYAKDEDAVPDAVAKFLVEEKARLISGKVSLLQRLKPSLQAEFRMRTMQLAILSDTEQLVADTSQVLTAQVEDIPEIVEKHRSIEEFRRLYTGGEQSLIQQMQNRIQSGEGVHMYIRQDGQIISHGNTTAETQASGMIGGVFTIPSYRGQGYAEKVVSALCKSLFSCGKTPCLFFDNPAAGRLYYKLGFVNNGQWGVLESISERKDGK